MDKSGNLGVKIKSARLEHLADRLSLYSGQLLHASAWPGWLGRPRLRSTYDCGRRTCSLRWRNSALGSGFGRREVSPGDMPFGLWRFKRLAAC